MMLDCGSCFCERQLKCDLLVKIDSSVGELSEGSSLLDLGGLLGVVVCVGHGCDLCG